MLELGDRLGPLLWQMNPYKKFDEADFGKFLELLPPKVGDQKLRHVVEVRHDSFKTPAFIALLRQFNVGIVYSEHETYTEIADVTSDFVYARLQKGDDSLATGYPPKALDAWAGAAEGLGRRRPAGRPAAHRQEGCAEATARRVRLRDPRRQGARAGGGDGTDQAAGMSMTRGSGEEKGDEAGAEESRQENAVSKTKRLFTIGYQQTPPKAVLDELENAGVKLLVDVRAVASSRRPGFSKNQLAAGLKERGIGYLHLRGLGTPTEGRLAARSGDMKALTTIYAKH